MRHSRPRRWLGQGCKLEVFFIERWQSEIFTYLFQRGDTLASSDDCSGKIIFLRLETNATQREMRKNFGHHVHGANEEKRVDEFGNSHCLHIDQGLFLDKPSNNARQTRNQGSN